jgi:hypothetical protein
MRLLYLNVACFHHQFDKNNRVGTRDHHVYHDQMQMGSLFFLLCALQLRAQYQGAVGAFCASGAKLSASASRQIMRTGISLKLSGCFIVSRLFDLTLKAL